MDVFHDPHRSAFSRGYSTEIITRARSSRETGGRNHGISPMPLGCTGVVISVGKGSRAVAPPATFWKSVIGSKRGRSLQKIDGPGCGPASAVLFRGSQGTDVHAARRGDPEGAVRPTDAPE